MLLKKVDISINLYEADGCLFTFDNKSHFEISMATLFAKGKVTLNSLPVFL